MKKISLSCAIVFILAACSSGSTKSGWSDTEKDVFIKNCIPGAQKSASMSATEAKNYCDCMMDKVEKKYPDAIDAGSLTDSDATEMAKGCIK